MHLHLHLSSEPSLEPLELPGGPFEPFEPFELLGAPFEPFELLGAPFEPFEPH
jgi:hypothetical protein